MEGFVLIGVLGIIGAALGVIFFCFQDNKYMPACICLLGFCLAYISFAYAIHLDKYNCELKKENTKSTTAKSLD